MFLFSSSNLFIACYNKDQGDYVVREGEAEDGIYFIWEGEVSFQLFVMISEEIVSGYAVVCFLLL